MVEKTEDRLDKMVNSTNTFQGALGVTGEFVLGVGPEEREFGPNHPLTKSLANSQLTQGALADFLEENMNAFVAGDLSKVRTYAGVAVFSPIPYIADSSPWQEKLNYATQMVGSAFYTISLNKDFKSLSFEVKDTKNRWSLLYHGVVPGTASIAVSRNRDDTQVMGTTFQTYRWSVPFNAQTAIKELRRKDVNENLIKVVP